MQLQDQIAALIARNTRKPEPAMNVAAIVEALMDAGVIGDSAKDRARVNSALWAGRTIVDGVKVKRFERVARGRYRCADTKGERARLRRK